MPGKPKQPERKLEIGQHIRVNLHTGRIEEATIRAIVERTNGLRWQVETSDRCQVLVSTAFSE